MNPFRRMARKVTIMVIGLASGTALLGSSCTADVRDSLVSAGLDFVGDSAITVLDTLIPVEDILTGADGA